MMQWKQLGENILPYADEKEEWQGEQDSSYRNPCYAKTDQEIYKLEECKYDYEFKWYRLHKRSMNSFQDPAMRDPSVSKIVGSQKKKKKFSNAKNNIILV
jgi:hypothetical protein